MSSDLTTTIVMHNEEEGGFQGARFIHASIGGLRLNVFLTDDAETTAYFSEDDAIMLRNWLNDEWPVEQRDDYGREAEAAMQADMAAPLYGVATAARDPLWGGTSPKDIPYQGCGCDACQEARRNG